MKTTLKKHIFIGCMVCLAILTIYVLPKNSMVASAAECAEATTGATVCSLSDPYTAPICFLPGSASTLLVKNGRVAINSSDVDRGTTSTTGTTASCETGYTYSGSIDKCVKTTCNTDSPIYCSDIVPYNTQMWWFTDYGDGTWAYRGPINGEDASAGWNGDLTGSGYNKTFLGYYMDAFGTGGTDGGLKTSAQTRAILERLISEGNSTQTLESAGFSAYRFYTDISGNPGSIRCTDCTLPLPGNGYAEPSVFKYRYIGDSGVKGTGSATARFIEKRPAICEDEFADLRGLVNANRSTTCTVDTKDPIRTPTTTNPATLLVVGVSGVRATQILGLSDIRIKTNIQKINNALADITRLNGYQFTWIDSGKPDFGVLAQEVEKVFASMVSEDSKGIKAVNYTELLAPIIEAIHEINTRVDELTREAQEQALRIETLEK